MSDNKNSCITEDQFAREEGFAQEEPEAVIAPCEECGSTDICCGDHEVGYCKSHCKSPHYKQYPGVTYYPEG